MANGDIGVMRMMMKGMKVNRSKTFGELFGPRFQGSAVRRSQKASGAPKSVRSLNPR